MSLSSNAFLQADAEAKAKVFFPLDDISTYHRHLRPRNKPAWQTSSVELALTLLLPSNKPRVSLTRISIRKKCSCTPGRRILSAVASAPVNSSGFECTSPIVPLPLIHPTVPHPPRQEAVTWGRRRRNLSPNAVVRPVSKSRALKLRIDP